MGNFHTDFLVMTHIKQKPLNRHDDDDDAEWGGGGVNGIVTLPLGRNSQYFLSNKPLQLSMCKIL